MSRWPWGDTEEPGRANVAVTREQISALGPVVAYETGENPVGVLQMVGNVWEMVTDTPPAEMVALYRKQISTGVEAGERWVLIRGGSYKEPLDQNILWDGVAVPAGRPGSLVGFRCVKDHIR